MSAPSFRQGQQTREREKRGPYAGCVGYSDPQSKKNECLSKAKALFRAGEEARRFANQAGRGQ